MQSLDSSSPKWVQTSAAAQALLDDQNFEILKCLMQAELSATELANALQMPLSKLHYRLRKLEALEIAVCVRSEPRHGRAIRYYRVLQTHWFVPFELTQANTPSKMIASQFQPMFEHFLESLGKLAERFTTANVWGVSVQLKDGDLDLDVRPPRPDPHLTGAVVADWTTRRLSREDALRFEARLKQLASEFLEIPEASDASESMLGLFLIEQQH